MHTKRTKSDLKNWLSAVWRKPSQMGAILPSGGALGQAMARHLNGNGGVVVEIGGGTGAITKALVARAKPGSRLITIEKQLALCRILERRFQQVEVVHADAADLSSLVDSMDLGPVDAVVSSLPLLNFSTAFRVEFLASVFSCLKDDGLFLQFTYSPLPPIPRKDIAHLHLNGKRMQFVPWNVPPATVWRYTRQNGSHAG